MLSQEELLILGAVHNDDPPSELQARVDESVENADALVDALVEQGLLIRSVDGISPSRARATTRYRDLVMNYHYIEFHEVLTPTALRVLYHLDAPRDREALATRTGLSPSDVEDALTPLCHRLFLHADDDGLYRLHDIGEALVEVARALAYHRHREDARMRVPQSTVLWATPDACLIKTTADLDDPDYIETGPVRLDDYGVRLMVTNQRYYYHRLDGDPTLSVGDVVCHVLLADADVRNITYGLLAFAHEDASQEATVERAAYYGVAPLVTQMFEFLAERGEIQPEGFPTWERFEEQAELYDIPV